VSRGAIGHDGPVSDTGETPDIGRRPEPQVNPDPETAPGGADATPTISDPGSTAGEGGQPLTPDQPLSAQTAETDMPDEIQESEGPDESIDDSSARPEVHPTD
jgi:hypothetical protein